MPRKKISAKIDPTASTHTDLRFCIFQVPCSCGMTFSVSADYDRGGGRWTRYLTCPKCGKKHDPRNRLLRLSFQREGYWRVDGC